MFGNIPNEVLCFELKEFEDTTKTLALMLAENSDEEIVKANYTISDGELQTFTAYTRSYVLKLKSTPLGYFLMKSSRVNEDLSFLDEEESNEE